MSKPTPDSTTRDEIIEILEEHATGMNQNLWSSLIESLESFANRVHSDAYVSGFNAGADDAETLLQEAEDRGYKKAKARLRQSITRMSRFKDDHIELPIDWWDRKLADLDAELTDKESK